MVLSKQGITLKKKARLMCLTWSTYSSANQKLNFAFVSSLPVGEELNLRPCKTSLSRSRASILAQGFTGESHVLHTLDQKSDSSTSEAARYLIVGIGFDVFGNGVTKGYCAGPIGVCTEWTKAGASTSCGRTRQRRWTLRHTKEKRRTATTSASNKAEEGGGYAGLLDQGGRAASECGCSGHDQRWPVHPWIEEG